MKPSPVLFATLLLMGASACRDSPEPSQGAPTPGILALPSEPREEWEWIQDFEFDTENFFTYRGGTIHREPSGFEAEYASGIQSSSGGWHARLRNPQAEGCIPPFSEEVQCGGTYSPLGREPVPNAVWPEGGYQTRIDIYLDAEWARANPDRRFDFSSAINRAGDGVHLRDFLFNVTTDPEGSGAFIAGTSLLHGRANANPLDPCPAPSEGRNGCRAPARLEGSGWYTFHHAFQEDGGDLRVDMAIFHSSGSKVAEWTLFDIPMEGVGGEHYGWFANQEIFDLAIDRVGKFRLP